MQFEGGYTYPSGRILILLSIGAIVITALVWCAKLLTLTNGASLFLGLEGTALLASSYTPVGLTPPNGNFFQELIWILKQQKGTSVTFNQPMFYGGLLCLFLSYIAAALAA